MPPEQRKYKNYQDFIGSHSIAKDDPKQATNTRITGGKFHIPDADYNTFLELYYRDIVAKNGEEFLTERQRDTDGPIAIDVDFRYDYETTEKQYGDRHVACLIMLYLETLKTMFQFTDRTPFPIYVFEKPSVNRIADKQITKDGIHIIIGVQADRATQTILRDRIIGKIAEEWDDIPIRNAGGWEDVFDKGISEGSVPWQLYGSNKPDHEKYGLTRVYEYEFDEGDGEFMETRVNIKKFDWFKDFTKLSVRYTAHPQFFYKADFIAVHDQVKTKAPKRIANRVAASTDKDVSQLKSHTDIEACVQAFLERLTVADYNLREAYELAMILPAEYYADGSYSRWIRVGWALRNIHPTMLIAWIAMSAKSPSFQFDSIPDLIGRWAGFGATNEKGLTKRSLMYWARESAPAEFKRVYESGIDYHLTQSITNGDDKFSGSGDADIAKILYMMYKDQFACAALKADKWYRFSKHRWIEDECGTSLRRSISEELRELYRRKLSECVAKIGDVPKGDPRMVANEAVMNKINLISAKLSQTTHKDHIMKEARELFFDPEVQFLDLLDSNPALMCFRNGVLDIKNRVFRPGRAEDYLSKCTKINYTRSGLGDPKVVAEINDFMEKLFPKKQLRDYMWSHLASILIGENHNQKMHMYIGGGENGKSVLTDLLAQCLGDYYAMAPITLITQPRQKQGSASPDIIALKGLRLAVMQEPSKNDRINDGAMKELTSCVEPIRGRNLNSGNVDFVPQCKIVVCSNNFMKVASTDHGTWRRIAVVDFESKFTDNPQKDDPEQPHQFKKDTMLKHKFPLWKEAFMAMLADIVLDSQGIVVACKMVDDASTNYREGEDVIALFIREKIVLEAGQNLVKADVTNSFNAWYSETYGRGGPAAKEVHEYLDKKLGKFKIATGCWTGARVRWTNETDTEPETERLGANA